MKKLILTGITALAVTAFAGQNVGDTYINSYLRFDLSQLSTDLEIDSAKVSVFRYRAYVDEITSPDMDKPSKFYVHKVLPTIPDYAMLPVQFAPYQAPASYETVMPHVTESALDSFDVTPGYHNWVDLNVTETVQDFIANPDNNKGFVFQNHKSVSLPGTTGSATGYFSSNPGDTIINGVSSNDARPKISIWKKGATEPTVFMTGKDGYGSNTLTNGTLEYGFFQDLEDNGFIIYCAVASNVRFVGHVTYKEDEVALAPLSVKKTNTVNIASASAGKVTLFNLNSGTYTVSLFSLKGRKLASTEVNIAGSQSVTPVSFGSIASGMVLCRIEGLGKTLQQKIMLK